MLIFTKMYITTNMKALEAKKNDENIGSMKSYEKLSKAKLGNFQLNFSIQEVNQAKNKPRFGQIWKKGLGSKKLCLPRKGQRA